jgi:hypothetical protein
MSVDRAQQEVPGEEFTYWAALYDLEDEEDENRRNQRES